MEPGLCVKPEEPPTKKDGLARRAAAPQVSVLLREQGVFPILPGVDGSFLDPSPLANLSPRQRRRRLVAVLEVAALYGDTAAAAEALRHARWEEEMSKGKAPARSDAGKTGELRVLDTLSAPPGIPIVRKRGRPRHVVDSQEQGDVITG